MSPLPRDYNIMDESIGVYNWRRLLRMDRLFVTLTLALCGIGLMTLFSASSGGGKAEDAFIKQLGMLPIGLAVAALIVCIDYRFLVSLGPLFFLISLLLLGLTLYMGEEVKGGQRWLALGPLRIQPSEFAKVALIYMLAWYLARIRHRVRSLPFFLLTFVIAALPAILILKQPNLGTAMVMGPVVFVMLWVAGCKKWHLIGLVLCGAAAAPLMWPHLEPHQKDRILTFLSPYLDDTDTGWRAEWVRRLRGQNSSHYVDDSSTGWQTKQTRITVGSGGAWGRGFMQGTQTHLKFLPEHHTDFIFALVAEETGFVGSVFVLGLFALLLTRGMLLAERSPDLSGALIGAGAITILFSHIFVSTAITIGLMPVTGIPMPFLSYGRSFLLAALMLVGSVLSLNVRRAMFEPDRQEA